MAPAIRIVAAKLGIKPAPQKPKLSPAEQVAHHRELFRKNHPK